MPRQRITRPQNKGQNRKVQMRNNTRNTRPMAFGQQVQGGLVQNPGMAQKPGLQPTQPQGQLQCPTGQIAKPGPDGRPTCMPTNQGPRRPGGAGIPTGNVPPKNRPGY